MYRIRRARKQGIKPFRQHTQSEYLETLSEMAAEVAEEVFADAEEGIAAEGEEAEEGLSDEQLEKMKADVAEVKDSVSEMKKDLQDLKSLQKPPILKRFVKFVAENVAIGAILYGTNVVLNKLSAKSTGSEKAGQKQKLDKINALSKLIQDLSNVSKTLTNWLTAHEKDTVTLEGIPIPLPDIFTKYTGKIESVSLLQW